MEQAFPRLVMPKEGSLPPRPPHLITVVKGLFLIFAHSFGVEHENIYIKVEGQEDLISLSKTHYLVFD